MKSKPIIVGVSAALFIVLIYVFGISDSAREQGVVKPEGVDVPALTLERMDGEKVELISYVGTPLVINSWAVWCPFCKDELSDFARLQEEFDGEIIVIAIDRAEDIGKVKEFTDSVGVSGGMELLLDPEDTFYKAIGGFAMPETIFVDGEGAIVTHKRGPMEYAEMKERSKELLGIK